MIRATVMLVDDTRIFEAYLRHPPRVGEYLWPQGSEREQIAAAHGTGSFLVKEVAHWCLPSHVPENQEAIHTIAVYVDPVSRSANSDDPATMPNADLRAEYLANEEQAGDARMDALAGELERRGLDL